ncbi:hypothetical protein OFP21_21990, partial [Escherichia coli]|nr:hypothetical protein [Escherichia coli]
TLYASDTLIRFNGENYISQSKVQKVSPSDSNPWRVFVDWPGTKHSFPRRVLFRSIPLSPAGEIAKRPAPIALPNSCAA